MLMMRGVDRYVWKGGWRFLVDEVASVVRNARRRRVFLMCEFSEENRFLMCM